MAKDKKRVLKSIKFELIFSSPRMLIAPFFQILVIVDRCLNLSGFFLALKSQLCGALLYFVDKSTADNCLVEQSSGHRMFNI